MKRRVFGIAAAAGAFSLACSRTANVVELPFWMNNPERRDNRELVLVLTPVSRPVQILVQTLRSELGSAFDVHTSAVSPETSSGDMGRWISALKPTVVVLVDNPTARTYARWARTQAAPPPAVIAMASFAEQLRRVIPNSTGVAFEPPAVASLIDARRLLGIPIQRVGVVYRRGFESFIAVEKARAELEDLELVSVAVRAHPSPRDLSRALMQLEDRGVHALWIFNDNRLLSNRLLQKAWLPFTQRHELPVIAGVPSLVSGEFHLGTYAAVPDVEGLGLQVADLIFGLREQSWVVADRPVQPPFSIRTYIDVERARRLGMPKHEELTVDVLVTSNGGP